MTSFLAPDGLLRVSNAARVIMAITLVAFGGLLSACGGSGGSDGGTQPPPPPPTPTVSSITVGPASASVAAGLTVQFTATAVYSDGSQKDVSQSATWASSATAIATVSATGIATGVTAGTSSVSATWSGVTGNDTLTVGPPNLTSIVVSPNKPTVAVGKTLQFSAIGSYTDRSTQDLTKSVAWSSSDTATATISTDSNSVGLATAVALGTTEIHASSGSVSASLVPMTVTATIYAYATNFDDGTVSQYVLGNDGSLAPLSVPAVSAGQKPFSISMEPTGEYVYVSNWGSSSVSQYRIASDGTLSAIGSGTVASGKNPNNVTIDHADRFAYVSNLGESTLSQYKIGLDGALIPMTTPKVASGSNPAALVVDPTNHFAYAANFGTDTYLPPPGPSTISQYSIGTDGRLTQIQTPSPSSLPAGFMGANTGADVHVAPSGKFVYGSNRGHDSIAIFAVDPTTGKLTAAGHQPTLGKKPRHFAIDPTGTYLLAANQESDNIAVFRIDRASGGLTPVGQPFSVPRPVCVLMVKS